MILLCYDGSSHAQSAIDRAGELLSGQPATVLTVWEPFVDATTSTSTGMGMGIGASALNFEQIDAASEQAAHERAEEGVERATRAGMNPQPRTRVRGATIADTILSEADELDASTIVIGSRGLTGLKSLLLGSVSHALLQHTDRTVIVIPSPEVAAKRAAHRHEARKPSDGRTSRVPCRVVGPRSSAGWAVRRHRAARARPPRSSPARTSEVSP